MHDERVFSSCCDELTKISKDVGQLLTNLATRKGLNPANIPGIKQVGNVAAAGNRGRAAEIAGSVKNFIKSPTQGKPLPRSAPGLASGGFSPSTAEYGR